MRDRRIAQLAAILQNGIEVRPDDEFPIGWDLNRNRIFAVANRQMLDVARGAGWRAIKEAKAPQERPDSDLMG